MKWCVELFDGSFPHNRTWSNGLSAGALLGSHRSGLAVISPPADNAGFLRLWVLSLRSTRVASGDPSSPSRRGLI